MEQCPVCGHSFGIAHDCPGPPATNAANTSQWPVPSGFALLRYIRQGMAIATLDDGAVMAASRDADALRYGAAIWIIGQVVLLTVRLLTSGQSLSGVDGADLVVALGFLILLSAIGLVVQYGICHLVALQWMGARGTFIGVLRPLLLGSVVLWLGIIPVIGFLIAGLWGIAVMMIVFEDVDGIGRLKAFFLSVVVGAFFQVLLVLGLAASGAVTPFGRF